MLTVSEWWGLPDAEKIRLIEVVQCRSSSEPWYEGFFTAMKSSVPVLDAFVQHVNRRRLLGGKRVSHKFVIEQMRYEGVRMSNGEPFNLNNNYTADIARLTMKLFDLELGGVFRLRERAIGAAA